MGEGRQIVTTGTRTEENNEIPRNGFEVVQGSPKVPGEQINAIRTSSDSLLNSALLSAFLNSSIVL